VLGFEFPFASCENFKRNSKMGKQKALNILNKRPDKNVFPKII
jgi:hypothetical protein